MALDHVISKSQVAPNGENPRKDTGDGLTDGIVEAGQSSWLNLVGSLCPCLTIRNLRHCVLLQRIISFS